jgi:hypothetical protein
MAWLTAESVKLLARRKWNAVSRYQIQRPKPTHIFLIAHAPNSIAKRTFFTFHSPRPQLIDGFLGSAIRGSTELAEVNPQFEISVPSPRPWP